MLDYHYEIDFIQNPRYAETREKHDDYLVYLVIEYNDSGVQRIIHIYPDDYPYRDARGKALWLAENGNRSARASILRVPLDIAQTGV